MTQGYRNAESYAAEYGLAKAMPQADRKDLLGSTAASTYRSGAWRTPEFRDYFGAPLRPIKSLLSR